MQFLPQDYEAPRSGGSYMKIQQGENKIRILTQPILGWEEWNKEKKPVRYRFDQKPDKALDSKNPPRHFWAFVVWNYQEEQIQILEVTQAGIRKGIECLTKDADWGAPFFYDIKIFKEGEEMKTKYTVNPLPHKPVASHIIDAFHEKPCKLDAMFDNDDPFAEWTRTTPGIFHQDKMEVQEEKAEKVSSISKEVISEKQADELEGILRNCDPQYRKSLMQTLAKEPLNVTFLGHIPVAYFERIKTAALKKAEEFAKTEVDWIMEA